MIIQTSISWLLYVLYLELNKDILEEVRLERLVKRLIYITE